jgi:hypothetical protein
MPRLSPQKRDGAAEDRAAHAFALLEGRDYAGTRIGQGDSHEGGHIPDSCTAPRRARPLLAPDFDEGWLQHGALVVQRLLR